MLIAEPSNRQNNSDKCVYAAKVATPIVVGSYSHIMGDIFTRTKTLDFSRGALWHLREEHQRGQRGRLEQ